MWTSWSASGGLLPDTEGVCPRRAAAAQRPALLMEGNLWSCLHKPDFGLALTSSSQPEATLLCWHWPRLITVSVSGTKTASTPGRKGNPSRWAALSASNDTSVALSCWALMICVPLRNAKESSCMECIQVGQPYCPFPDPLHPHQGFTWCP